MNEFGANALLKAVVKAVYGMQVVNHMLVLSDIQMREHAAVDTDSDEEDLNNRINRLWRTSLQPLVKSYSHASM